MHVIEVIPIGRGTTHGTLSYFSSTVYERGVVLSIPIRGRLSRGVVISCTEVSVAKTALRAATFSLRKIPEQTTPDAISDTTLKTIDELAEYYAASAGAVLFNLLPRVLLEHPSHAVIACPETDRAEEESEYSHSILQATASERLVQYQSIVRASFAAQKSVLCVAPTMADIAYLHETLARGIKDHVVVLHGSIGTKALDAAYTALADTTHPKLIVTTPQYALVERSDIGTVVLERSRAKGYRAHKRPYIDFKKALLTHSRHAKRHVVSGDILIATEDEWLIREGYAESFGEQPKRLSLQGTLTVHEIVATPDGTIAFQFFSKKLLQSLASVVKKKERAFLFAARRGLAPVVACVDCGHILRAPESGAPLSLHRRVKNGVEERWLICSVSGYRERAPDLCPACGSWRLKERGIGIQQVYDELKKHIDESRILLFDHTTANTPKKAAKLQKEFYAMKGSVLLGTALALPYLKQPVSLSAVTSMDALQAIPTWRGQEEVLATLLTLREVTRNTVFVQTRGAEHDVLEYATKGSIAAFYDSELAVREEYKYPPHAVFIHLTWIEKSSTNDAMTERIKTLFSDDGISVYSTLQEESAAPRRQGLIRVSSHLWPHDHIVDKLRQLPPSVRIMVNPDRII